MLPSTDIIGGSNNADSGSSGASVDEERPGAGPNANFRFGADPVSQEERNKLAKRISGPDGVTTGGCEHKTRLLEKIGGGSFGDVYLGEKQDSKLRVAVKIEPTTCGFQSLLHEGNVYRKLQNRKGIPTVHWYGLHGREFTAMVMDLMGPTLYSRWVECGERFSLKTVLMLVDQMVETMEHVHGSNFVHRDISPNNFMFGIADKATQLHLIDFGHAKEMPNTQQFIPATRRHRFSFAQPMVGTPRFASVFTHMGFEPSYRDDMESLGFVWIYLLKGRLPWQGLRPTLQQDKLDLIARMKINTPVEVLCEDLPQEFAVYMNYVRNLKHLEMPNHAEIRDFFRKMAADQNIDYDWKFDWITEKAGKLTPEDVEMRDNEQDSRILVKSEDWRSASANSERTNVSK